MDEESKLSIETDYMGSNKISFFQNDEDSMEWYWIEPILFLIF